MEANVQQRQLADKWRAFADFVRARPIAGAAIMVALGGALAVLGAWFFQYGLGFQPCPLCYEQRYPYYFGVPLALLLILGESAGSRRRVLLGGLLALTGLMLWNAVLGGYHAGIEWKWWAGPPDCSGSFQNPGRDLIKNLQSIRVVRCDEAAWRFLGLSLAGYNALIAIALAAVAAWGFVRGLKLPVARD